MNKTKRQKGTVMEQSFLKELKAIAYENGHGRFASKQFISPVAKFQNNDFIGMDVGFIAYDEAGHPYLYMAQVKRQFKKKDFNELLEIYKGFFGYIYLATYKPSKLAREMETGRGFKRGEWNVYALM